MSWDDILGQDRAKRVLQVHLADGRVANGYLLVGPEGVGKRRLAIEMAKALNCTAGGSRPCDDCPTCRQIIRSTHPDVHFLVPGGPADQIRIEQIRQLLSRIMLRPFNATMQVAIIDGAERLTEEAANSLLKALEEPPAHTRFLLTTTQLSRCLATIVSRCQVVRCQPLRLDLVQRVLLDGRHCEARTAETIVRLSGGSASRAIELAGRWSSYRQVLARLASGTPAAWIEEPSPETREEVTDLLDGMMAWLRDIAVAAVLDDPSRLAHAEHAETLRRQARSVDVDRCVELAFKLVGMRESLEQFVSPRLVASLARESWLSLREVKS
ncbi:MAG: DNA polymerase III subunit delta' [Candidatus Omnitrophica bacterium]|nr:DNA polymerase III subunit delta' [Candidatus Omnitrophota bacterium]